eukprot:NODE_899_length_3200_cov_0.194776.p4 type:complete len:103 gc:universal NODE_899_length_3200_cov_0.194776:2773-2465(-)
MFDDHQNLHHDVTEIGFFDFEELIYFGFHFIVIDTAYYIEDMECGHGVLFKNSYIYSLKNGRVLLKIVSYIIIWSDTETLLKDMGQNNAHMDTHYFQFYFYQ